MTDAAIFLGAPVRLIASHGFNWPGFQSVKHGVFATSVDGPPHFTAGLSMTDVHVLGFKLASLTISPPPVDEPLAWQQLAIVFKAPHLKADVLSFLDRLAVGITALYASGQRDPWYGNLYVDVGWSAVRTSSRLDRAAEDLPIISTNMRSTEYQTLNAEKLASLRVSDLTEIFVDGMRAAQPKSKYANWFIPLEELETLATKDFKGLFNSLFRESERENVAKSSGLTGDQLARLKSFLGNPNHTIENRSDKLQALLTHLHLDRVQSIKGDDIVIDLPLCKRLIAGRNSLAHKGQKVDEDLLYTILFPLAYRVLQYLESR